MTKPVSRPTPKARGQQFAPGSLPRENDERKTSLDALAVLHELQVHQVELEAQNAELLRLQGELQNALEDYSVLYQSAPIAYLNLDADGSILRANRKAGELLGMTPEALVGRSLLRFFRHLSGDRLATMLGPPGISANQSSLELEMAVEPLDQEAGRRVRLEVASERPAGTALVLMTDITERRTLEEALLDSGHRERLHLAADLHDGLGQDLAGLCMRVTAMAKDAEREVPLRPGELRECVAELRHALDECRALARGLSPLAVYHGGLAEALRQHAVHCQALGAPAVVFTLNEQAPNRLPRGALDHLYRIAQEGVGNARRHAGAHRVDLRLDIQSQSVTLRIADDGCGIDPRHETQGLGLRLMRHRASLMGAELSVESVSGGGTHIRCVVPQPVAKDPPATRGSRRSLPPPTLV